MPFHFHSVSEVREERTILVPSHLENKAALLVFLAQAIPLPDYFGKNWDALEECLADLSWLPGSKLTLEHEELPLKREPTNQQSYLLVLASAAKEEPNLRVVFPERCREEVARLLAI